MYGNRKWLEISRIAYTKLRAIAWNEVEPFGLSSGLSLFTLSRLTID